MTSAAAESFKHVIVINTYDAETGALLLREHPHIASGSRVTVADEVTFAADYGVIARWPIVAACQDGDEVSAFVRVQR